MGASYCWQNYIVLQHYNVMTEPGWGILKPFSYMSVSFSVKVVVWHVSWMNIKTDKKCISVLDWYYGVNSSVRISKGGNHSQRWRIKLSTHNLSWVYEVLFCKTLPISLFVVQSWHFQSAIGRFPVDRLRKIRMNGTCYIQLHWYECKSMKMLLWVKYCQTNFCDTFEIVLVSKVAEVQK